jgi:hypothetical protein
LNLKLLEKRWKKEIVFRQEIGKFSRGLIGKNYMANLDSQGKGPKRYQLKGKIYYKTADLIKWLEERMEVVS